MEIKQVYAKGDAYAALDCVGIIHKLMQVEYDSVFKYLVLMKNCDDQRFIHLTELYYKYAMEEEKHFKRHLDFLIDLKYPTMIPCPVCPAITTTTCDEIFSLSLEHEKFVTASYASAMKRALELNDHMLHEHLGWYLSEQVEEHKKFLDWIDFCYMLGSSPQKMFEVDKLAESKL